MKKIISFGFWFKWEQENLLFEIFWPLGDLKEGRVRESWKLLKQVYFRRMSLHVCMAGLETKTNLYINAGFKGRIGIVVGAKMYPSTTLNCTLPGLFGERHFHTSIDRKSEHCQSFYLLKFSFSEKATKIGAFLPHGFDIYIVNVKTMRKIVQIFVAFSEKLYLIFTKVVSVCASLISHNCWNWSRV